MKIFGYLHNDDNLLELAEVSIECTIEQLEKIINFLNIVKEQHAFVATKTNMCHSHYRDWDSAWNDGDSDIIVVTKFSG